MKLMQERLTADRQLATALLFVTCVKFQLTLFNFGKLLGGINRFDLVSQIGVDVEVPGSYCCFLLY